MSMNGTRPVLAVDHTLPGGKVCITWCYFIVNAKSNLQRAKTTRYLPSTIINTPTPRPLKMYWISRGKTKLRHCWGEASPEDYQYQSELSRYQSAELTLGGLKTVILSMLTPVPGIILNSWLLNTHVDTLKTRYAALRQQVKDLYVEGHCAELYIVHYFPLKVLYLAQKWLIAVS